MRPLAPQWEVFCQRGCYSTGNQRSSVGQCMTADGTVRGHYSDLELDPTLPERSALYPSHDHRTHRGDDTDMVVDARLVNDMKSLMTEDEFWRVVEHMYCVGLEKAKVHRGAPRRLPPGWAPKRNY